MTPTIHGDWRQEATLGFGLGLPLGALGIAHTDPTTAAIALVAGLGFVAIVLLSARTT